MRLADSVASPIRLTELEFLGSDVFGVDGDHLLVGVLHEEGHGSFVLAFLVEFHAEVGSGSAWSMFDKI